MTRIIPNEGDFENDAVTIPVDEYLRLHAEVKLLRYLEAHGVSTWDGYERAVEAWRSNE